MATVLVVDDEPEIRASLRGILAEEGLRVIEAEDGGHALALAQREDPDLVILDIWMPEMDGLQLLRRLNHGGGGPEVIMISGHGNIETAVKATKLGAFDFIEKPFSLDGLLRVVNRALAHQAAARRHRTTVVGAGTPPSRPDATTGPVLEQSQPRQWRERTIGRSVVASGHGLHSGVKTGLILQPLPPGSGILFTSPSADDSVLAHLDKVDSTGYSTSLHGNGVVARTVEHLLATLHAYRVTNLLVKMQDEVPIMDGSAIEFCRLLDQAGVVEQERWVENLAVRERIVVGKEDGENISIEPIDGLEISYLLRYPHPVGEQEYTYVHRGPESFRSEIAPARTFGFLRDMKHLATMGLATGGRLDNCILIDDEKVVNTTLRYPDEFVRHKILDVMGDMYLLGRPLCGRIRAHMTGHSDNIALLREIRRSAGLA
jgi:UDP-3-O-[3-hydroxymyristoyl] N-acetylglucosamine deacetylase